AFDPATTNRELYLAISDAGQVAWLPVLTARMATEMPRARLSVVAVDTLVARGGLSAGEIDVLLGRGQSGPGIHVAAVCEERLVLVARRGHPILQGRATKPKLAALRHADVHVAAGHTNRDLVKAYARLGITRDVAVVVPTFTAAAAIVAGTDLV